MCRAQLCTDFDRAAQFLLCSHTAKKVTKRRSWCVAGWRERSLGCVRVQVMGHPEEVLLWAKAAADGKELSQHPIIRTTNMPESSMTIVFNQHAVTPQFWELQLDCCVGQVIPNFYTIQHGWNTSFYALRHWLFEAQNLKDVRCSTRCLLLTAG